MNLKIQNYRGILDVDLDLKKVTLIAGDNFQGKTSIAQALSCALTGEPLPWAKAKKTQGKVLVYEGKKSGMILCAVDDNNYIKIKYPDCDVVTKGIIPKTHPLSTSLFKIIDMDKKARAELFTEVLRASPNKSDLYAALKKEGINNEAVGGKIWETIDALGWEAAFRQAETKGTESKGAWRQITGENYGSKKAESWEPDGWFPKMDETTLENLQKLVDNEKEWLESAQKSQAYDEGKLQAFKEKIEKKDEIQNMFDINKKAIERLIKIKTALNDWINKNPDHESVELKCAHCGKLNEMTAGGNLIKWQNREAEDSQIDQKKSRVKNCGR